MISGGMIAGGVASAGGVTGPAAPPAPAADTRLAVGDIALPMGEISGDVIQGNATGQPVPIIGNKTNPGILDTQNKQALALQKNDHKFQLGMKNMDYMSQVWSGLFNFIGQGVRDVVQGIMGNKYFNSQVTMQDRQALSNERIAGKNLKWNERAAESFDKQNELLYSRGGFAEQRERIHSETAIAMNESKERGKTERAALRGVDEAFGLDSRDSYGYGNPFANA